MLKTTTWVVIALATGTAFGDTVRLEFDSLGDGPSASVNLGSGAAHCLAGRLAHSFSTDSGSATGFADHLLALCTNLTQPVTPHGAACALSGFQDLPGGGSMNSAKFHAIDTLDAAPFKVAIWEVVYTDDPASGSSLKLAAGDLKVGTAHGPALGSAVMSRAGFLFGTVGSHALQAGILGLRHRPGRDQAPPMQLVPLPPAAWAGIFGLGAAAYARRCLRPRP